jgi:hypothetical protein
VTRTLTCSVLTVLSIFLLWYSFSGMNAPSSARGGPAASLASELSSQPNKAPRPSRPGRISAGGAGGRATIAPNSSIATTAANQFTCKTQCQAIDKSCQGACYHQYNVTNQTQYWSQCMQSCGTTLSGCSNGCTAGLSPSSISPMAFIPPPQALPPPSQSKPTPSLPPQFQDQSSSSSTLSPPSPPSPSSSSLKSRH